MNRLRVWRRNFNWRMFVVRMLVNALALLIVVAILPNVYFVDKRVVVWVFLSLMLGLLNAFVKPIIAFLTLRFIFATGGLVLALINGLILWVLAWLFPTLLALDTLLSALLGGLVLGVSSAFLEALLGLNPPIVAEKYPEIRERIKDRQFYRTRMVPARIAAGAQPSTSELEVTTDSEVADLPSLTPKTSDALTQDAPVADDNEAALAATAAKPEA